MTNKGNVLVIAAHPDDEVLGCGGTIARLAKEGHFVNIAILGEGITSRYKQQDEADAKLVQVLREKSQRVAECLGAKQPFTFNLPDNRFDTVPLLDIVKMIEDLIMRIQPQIIYTQHGGDLNIDHGIVFRATLTASRPILGCSVKTIYAYEVPSSTEWSMGKFKPSFQPNAFMDIQDTLELKLKAMALYESEMRTFPHPRSAEALRAIASRWGSVSGCQAAEAFELIRDLQ
jgi:LmbE family N-acetylglucosaminyl deacetylase